MVQSNRPGKEPDNLISHELGGFQVGDGRLQGMIILQSARVANPRDDRPIRGMILVPGCGEQPLIQWVLKFWPTSLEFLGHAPLTTS